MLAGPLAALQQLRLLSRGSGLRLPARFCVHLHGSKASARVHRRASPLVLAQASPLTTDAQDKMSGTDDGSSAPVSAEEVEALRKQVEALKVIAADNVLH